MTCQTHEAEYGVETETLDRGDWFNNQRLLDQIGNIPPIEFEDLYYEQKEEPAMVAGLKQ